MQCVLCRHGATRPGETTVTLERDGVTVVLRGVPADICENCGEYSLSEAVTRRVLALGEAAVAGGAEVAILRYAA